MLLLLFCSHLCSLIFSPSLFSPSSPSDSYASINSKKTNGNCVSFQDCLCKWVIVQLSWSSEEKKPRCKHWFLYDAESEEALNFLFSHYHLVCTFKTTGLFKPTFHNWVHTLTSISWFQQLEGKHSCKSDADCEGGRFKRTGHGKSWRPDSVWPQQSSLSNRLWPNSRSFYDPVSAKTKACLGLETGLWCTERDTGLCQVVEKCICRMGGGC